MPESPDPTALGALCEPVLTTLLSSIGDAVVVLDESGRCLRSSRRALDVLGYSTAEELSHGGLATLLVAQAGTAAHETGLAGAMEAEQHHLVRWQPYGHGTGVEIDVWPLDGDHQRLLVAIVRDVARVRADNVPPPSGEAAIPLVIREVAAPDLSSHFAIAVSHELRTPLTTILGSAELLLDSWRQLDNATRYKGVERLLSGARRLDLLVRDLLLVMGLEDGDLEIHAVRTPLAPVLEQALYEASAVHPNLDVRARGLRHAPIVWADPDRVVQVLVHLLDNAARHGQGAGPPELRVESGAGMATIHVRDRGPGLPREGRDRLFTRFGKLSQASHAGRIGTGLGLYTSRLLVEAMSGAIGVESTPGKGAHFWFTLPLAGPDGRDG